MKTTVIESMARAGDADVDPIIAAWAKAGVFDEIGLKAIAQSHANGNAVTIIEDGVVYRYYPDGTKQELRRLQQRIHRQYSQGRFRVKK